jgi:hypothetical protein
VGALGSASRARRGRIYTADGTWQTARDRGAQPVEATLEFAAPNAAGGPCRLSLATPVSLGPAEMKTVSLGESSAVTRCMPQPATGGPARAFVLKPRELTGAQAPARDLGNAVLHPADLNYSFEIGGRAVTDKATWLFAVE